MSAAADTVTLMPLSAVFRDERLESWGMPADEWAALKASYRADGLTMACGQPGIPKTSQRGLQFFAHKPGADCIHDGGPESPEHLATKAAVARAARAIGWDATIEYPAPDRSWIADVLVTNGARRIAIEAQWSPQSHEDFVRRQQRYEAAGLECFWLVPEGNTANAWGVPHYTLWGGVDGLSILLPAIAGLTGLEIEDAIAAILRQEIAAAAELVAMAATIYTQMSKCWHCGRWMSLWTVSAIQVEARCGSSASVWWPTRWDLWAAQRHEQPLEQMVRKAILASDLPAPIKLGVRRSETKDTPYLAMLCPSCSYVQGDGMIKWHGAWDDFEIPLGMGIRYPFSDEVRHAPHVCRDIGRGRCSQQPTPGTTFPLASEHAQLVHRDGFDAGAPLPPRGARRR